MNAATTTPGADDRAAIAAIVQGQAEAWNHADADTFAEHYAKDGSFTNIVGVRGEGKAEFVALHAQIFRTIFAGSRMTFAIDRVRFLRSDVAVVNIDAALADIRQAPPGIQLGSDGVLHSKLQEVMTREDGCWQIAAFHNVAVTQVPTR